MPIGCSYQTADFISQNKELEQAFATTCQLYKGRTICFVNDSGLDDQKMFAYVVKLKQEFIFRVSHLERIVEVHNDRLDRWKTEKLQDLVESVPHQVTFQVVFKHAGNPDSTRCILAGSRFTSQAHNNRCGSWSLMLKL